MNTFIGVDKEADVEVYEFNDEILLLPSSMGRDWLAVAELPPDRSTLSVDDATLGEVVLTAARRCRGKVDEPPTKADDIAQAMGFKSHAVFNRATNRVGIGKSPGSSTFRIYATKRRGVQIEYVGEAIEVSIDNPSEIGRAVREAIFITRAANVPKPKKPQ